MNAYRLSGKVAEDRTITVQVPEALVGSEAEIIVLFPKTREIPVEDHPLRRFLGDLRQRTVDPEGAKKAEEAQVALQEMRAEWD